MKMKIDTLSWEPSSVCNMKIRCPPCSHVSRPSIEDYVAIHDGAPPLNENIATNFTGRNLLTFCTFVPVAGGSSSVSFFLFFSNRYIFLFSYLKLIVKDNLVSRIFKLEILYRIELPLEYDCDGEK